MMRAIAGTVAALAIGFVVWFVGFDVWWAAAATLVVIPVVVATAIALSVDESISWEAPARATPRGMRLTVAALEQSLAACDRLGGPAPMRRIGALLVSERDDRLARSTVVRQMRALLIAELHDRGIAASEPFDEAVASFGDDARAVLQSHEDHPVTAAAIARCLDAIERNATTTPGSR